MTAVRRLRDAGTVGRRFVAPHPHANREQAGLPERHPAVVEGRTLFPRSVVDPDASPRLLVSGANQSKIGARVQKGPWAGLPIYCLTLEERATCPRSCHVYRECYGNAMHWSRRHRHGPDLERELGYELARLMRQHPEGIAVRLHILGDFYSTQYVRRWQGWLATYEHRLFLFGFTAHDRGSRVGAAVERMNARFPAQSAIRFSVGRPTGQPMEATTFWDAPAPGQTHNGDALICPAQSGRTDCCATCGLCWHAAMDGTAIAFVGHGMRAATGPRKAAA